MYQERRCAGVGEYDSFCRAESEMFSGVRRRHESLNGLHAKEEQLWAKLKYVQSKTPVDVEYAEKLRTIIDNIHNKLNRSK